MADVTGSISSLPGSRHKVPDNQACDNCGAPAVVRVQGETDSMGSEMIDLCQTCADNMKAAILAYNQEPKCCDWCHTIETDCKPYRDADEGSGGPVYTVCKKCRLADGLKWAEEAA